ncbi:hypothetical protein N7532_000297 [Penicillium argentinense]|uniref:Fatty acid hydroxylase domain-containing protein n=1 Tax=Penicillium argentinense TaxID=1131581 RepID=A0A9W9G6I0_9EURO|nr:uncharacterized protein N7532_000297 [Penicillium argentinense]KAJ5112252.1 hypothetical protein N7532_000297 [Penicillium argentinense]
MIPISIQTWIVQELSFLGTALFCEYADTTTARSLRVREPDRKGFMKMLPQVLFNQFFVLLPCMILTEWLGLCFTGISYSTLIRIFVIFYGMALGHDIVQYTTHRFLLHNHNIRLMRVLRHSVHHTTTASRGISACYMFPTDYFLEIVLPYLVPLAVLGGGGMSRLFHFPVAGLGAAGGVYEHSGYDLCLSFHLHDKIPAGSEGSLKSYVLNLLFKWLSGTLDNRAHGEHHARANISFSDGFGSPEFCDTIFGTRWNVSKARRQADKEWKTQWERFN